MPPKELEYLVKKLPLEIGDTIHFFTFIELLIYAGAVALLLAIWVILFYIAFKR